MKKTSFLASLCLIAAALTVAADVFVLRDGTRLEGTIVLEDEENYVIEVQVTRTIKEEVTVAKADVARVERERPEDSAFEAIQTLVPTPDRLTLADYDARVARLDAFLDAHGNSEHAADVRRMLNTLAEERNVVEAGGIKLGGELISPEDRRANRLELDAREIESDMRARAEAGDVLGALRVFDQLEAEFAGTAPHGEAVPLYRRALTSWRDAVQQQLDTHASRSEERERGLTRMSATDRTQSQRAIAEEAEQLELRFQQEKQAGHRWVTPHPFHRGSLEENLRLAESELRRLENPPQASDRGRLFRETLSGLKSAEEKQEVDRLLGEARSANLPARYLSILESAAPSLAD